MPFFAQLSRYRCRRAGRILRASQPGRAVSRSSTTRFPCSVSECRRLKADGVPSSAGDRLVASVFAIRVLPGNGVPSSQRPAMWEAGGCVTHPPVPARVVAAATTWPTAGHASGADVPARQCRADSSWLCSRLPGFCSASNRPEASSSRLARSNRSSRFDFHIPAFSVKAAMLEVRCLWQSPSDPAGRS